MFADYHVHTEYSDDSRYPMEQVVKDAIALGMDEICFTDHVDYGIKLDHADCDRETLEKAGTIEDDEWEPGMERVVLNVDYPAYFEEIASLREKYPQIKIKAGLEFGMQRHTKENYEKLIKKYGKELDFVLLSVHQIENKEFWTGEFMEGKSQLEYNRRYYEELKWLVDHFKNYSVLAHLDLIVRYDKQGVLPFEEVEDLVTDILKTVIADGKGIEVNTSSVRYGLKELTPSRQILELYRKLGGKILTFGSDSHRPDHLGKYIETQKKELRDLGFEQYCTYVKGKPVWHPL